MSDKRQLHPVTATVRERYLLAVVLLTRHETKGEGGRRQLDRVFSALALEEYEDMIARDLGPVPALWASESKHEVTDEAVEYFVGVINAVNLNGLVGRALGKLAERLQAAQKAE